MGSVNQDDTAVIANRGDQMPLFDEDARLWVLNGSAETQSDELVRLLFVARGQDELQVAVGKHREASRQKVGRRLIFGMLLAAYGLFAVCFALIALMTTIHDGNHHAALISTAAAVSTAVIALVYSLLTLSIVSRRRERRREVREVAEEWRKLHLSEDFNPGIRLHEAH